MRHPASRARMGQSKGNRNPDYFKVKGMMKKKQAMNTKNKRRDSDHERKSDSPPLRSDRNGAPD